MIFWKKAKIKCAACIRKGHGAAGICIVPLFDRLLSGILKHPAGGFRLFLVGLVFLDDFLGNVRGSFLVADKLKGVGTSALGCLTNKR